MSNSSKLDEVVKNLEQDINLNRIKKVMICACRGKWENNQNNLKDYQTKNLVQELYWKTQTLENLYKILDRILSKINKKSEYTLIINTILNQVAQLYLESPSNLSGVSVSQNNTSASLPKTPQVPQRNQPERSILFDVRWRIMQYTNPLRVKVLLFSSLEQEFDLTNPDWSQLKLHSLENLLLQLLRNFTNLSDLQAHLMKMANYLDHCDENIQTVDVIIESLKPIYAKNQEKTPSQFSEKINSTVTEVGTLSQISTQSQLNPAIKNSNFSLEKSAFNSSRSYSNLDSMLSEKLASTQSTLLSTSLQTEQLTNLNNQLESQVKRIVIRSVKKTIYPINQTWDELQNLLDLYFQNLKPEESSELKKQALQELINALTAKINELQSSLNQQETRQAQPSQTSQTSGISRPNILELAQQGNSKAIATLINQSLQSKGIHAQVKTHNGCLHVVLAAEQVPNPESLVALIHKKLVFLKIQSIQSLKIHGRQIGKTSIAWTQQFSYSQLKG
ncbi:MAG: hypothetical protein SWJ54_01795 [Cyanobacteriota bacterium]|nr:hypothetical protein [Cyanobacteriota bacterium]